MNHGTRLHRSLIIGVTVVCTFLMTTPALSGASTTTTTFAPNAHKAALLKALNALPHEGKTNELRITRSPINSTWVYYSAGILVPVSGGPPGEDIAGGFAHWANGKWIIVYGPWSVGCGPLNKLTKMPIAVRDSFKKICGNSIV